MATDALVEMERAMARDGIHTNDRQLACARITSKEGQDYLAAMAAAANYAWVNRSSMTFLTRCGGAACWLASLPALAVLQPPVGLSLRFTRHRQAFGKMFNASPDDLDMHVVYDVSHNIAKVRAPR